MIACNTHGMVYEASDKSLLHAGTMCMICFFWGPSKACRFCPGHVCLLSLHNVADLQMLVHLCLRSGHESAHRFTVCQQLANVITNEGADGDVAGAAHPPPPPIAGLEHLQRQLQPPGHHSVPLLLAVVFGLTG